MKEVLIGALMVLAGTAACAEALAPGDVPQTTNTKVELREAGANLDATLTQVVAEAKEAMWIGYEVEEVPTKEVGCCSESYGNNEQGTFWLEDEHGNGGGSGSRAQETKLEGGKWVMILFRAEKNQIEKIRIAPAMCRLDAGGLRLVWLKNADARQSVAFLSELLKGKDFFGRGDHGLGEQALTAIALHADSAADQALEGLTSPSQPEALREKAAFWMGATRGAEGFAGLQKLARTDSNSNVRAQVCFALFVSHEPGAAAEIIRMAHEDTSAHVRGQALFWLAQRAGQKAEKTITGAIANDPDTEVKKKAVFALSQMPKDEGVPKLIEVAETNRNPEVRKQAMFWLGQSDDPRALAFIEKVLKE